MIEELHKQAVDAGGYRRSPVELEVTVKIKIFILNSVGYFLLFCSTPSQNETKCLT